ncbi:methyl-accepting chemotaxis protein [Hydrogenophaga sp. PAMC20947]|uniref:methyl-accepting chemotaxis protein n=1 Tax=Hydrogenophaga sp. PAMC20947 TaxID=2565558 RepID=UPI00109DFB65|nr:methyl-accepting chemotaxis protein [Hydrogenophaga sp. PAMC20947]QCB47709.1 HAMP domain-containing protein [Hydrogenophaga sp. PAMC20947]
MQVFMRRFSIRFRMMAAIGVVLCLLILIGGAGFWGLQHTARLSDRFVTQDFQKTVTLSRLRMALADTSRYEKDMVIQYESPEQLSLASFYWERSRKSVIENLALMQTDPQADVLPLVQRMQQNLDAYVKEVEPVVQRIQTGAFVSATVANRALVKAQERYAQLLNDMKQIETLMLARADALHSEGRATTQETLIGFALALALAVLVVVPATLANMLSICRPLEEAQRVASAITRGDLTQQIPGKGRDELTALMQALSEMQGALSRIVGEVRRTTDGIHTASREIASGNQDLSVRTEQAASNLQQTVASIDQITSTLRQSADAARQATEMAVTNAAVAQRGGLVVAQVVSTMQDIHDSSQKISDIIGVIDGIAFQTNILALNAAVEAARAGEQGRGFAVVAGEVRNLAKRSADAAKEIKSLIANSVERVATGRRLVTEAGTTIQDIVVNAHKVSSFIAEITTAAHEQSDGIGQVNAAVGHLDQMTQQNAALVEQGAAAAESLRDQAGRLTEVVQVFQLSAADPTPA